MFHILVVLLIKSQIVTYTLPRWFINDDQCDDHVAHLETNWKLRRGAILIGYYCQRVIEAHDLP